jgi:hypothetical protein
MDEQTIRINCAPVLTLWTAVVAERPVFDRATLSRLGRSWRALARSRAELSIPAHALRQARLLGRSDEPGRAGNRGSGRGGVKARRCSTSTRQRYGGLGR